LFFISAICGVMKLTDQRGYFSLTQLLDSARQLLRGGETRRPDGLRLPGAHPQGHGSNEARDTFGVADQVQLIAGEGAHLTRRQDHPGGDHRFPEKAVGKGAESHTALGQPAADGAGGRAGGIGAQRQAALVQLLLQGLPDDAGAHCGGLRVRVNGFDLGQPGQVHDQPAGDRQDAAVAGGCLGARHQGDAVLPRKAHQLDNLFLAEGLHHARRHEIAYQRRDQ
jgi:hypothetical protein